MLCHQDIEDALSSRTRMLVLTADMPDNWVSIHHTTKGQLVHYSVGLVALKWSKIQAHPLLSSFTAFTGQSNARFPISRASLRFGVRVLWTVGQIVRSVRYLKVRINVIAPHDFEMACQSWYDSAGPVGVNEPLIKIS